MQASINELKEQMCEIGRRIWLRGFCAGNEGNHSVRIDANRFLCTPTGISKGFLTPEDIVVVNAQGEPVEPNGNGRQRSSEVLVHLAIYKQRPDIGAVIHSHPSHAVAFCIAGMPLPEGVHPEAEVFLGKVPVAPYATPGTQKVADGVVPFVAHSKIVILANHGTVSFDEDLERAFWWTEVLDSYCRVLMLARQLGPVARFDNQAARELLEIKQGWGFDDPRQAPGLEDCDLCGNDAFRASWSQAGLAPRAFEPAPSSGPGSPPVPETASVDLVEQVTRQVLRALSDSSQDSSDRRS